MCLWAWMSPESALEGKTEVRGFSENSEAESKETPAIGVTVSSAFLALSKSFRSLRITGNSDGNGDHSRGNSCREAPANATEPAAWSNPSVVMEPQVQTRMRSSSLFASKRVWRLGKPSPSNRSRTKHLNFQRAVIRRPLPTANVGSSNVWLAQLYSLYDALELSSLPSGVTCMSPTIVEELRDGLWLCCEGSNAREGLGNMVQEQVEMDSLIRKMEDLDLSTLDSRLLAVSF
ncbi:hypothetical protein DFP72DRAFT_849674 [Ephemerocybe angulata]|uniref:Uncharacterized protein n=1 Tax=Ephemerocybe angulata TaxID=980116 RepID=A0A8H6HW69_9AGAR|nr:hypothetical protein DFP72DRAFT_849674 [Tulosesus angulatus]